jgi:tetratricopeptide (TPR) repeat protein
MGSKSPGRGNLMLRRLALSLTKAVVLFSAVAVFAGLTFCIVEWIGRPSPGSPEGLVSRADEMAWNNDWNGAAPLYTRAETLFRRKGDMAHALYAKVGRVPVLMEKTNLASLIAELNENLKLPAASAPDIRSRILEVKGRCEEEYDAGLAAQTFAEVQSLALSRHKLYLASRASGERGIMLFTLGKFGEAATLVQRAYGVAKYLRDPAAHVRFASMIGMGLTQMGRPKQALVFLDEAITTQKKYPQVASPYVAINAKVDCLSTLGRNAEALSLADAELTRLKASRHLGQLQSLLTSRAGVLKRAGRTKDAIGAYTEALGYAVRLSAWRAVTNIDAALADAYRHSGNLPGALSAINDAIYANSQAPDEIFLVPGNLALKAKILAEMGKRSEAENTYQKGAQMVDVLLSSVPTPGIEESLLLKWETSMLDIFSSFPIRDGCPKLSRLSSKVEAGSKNSDLLSTTRLFRSLVMTNGHGSKASRRIF